MLAASSTDQLLAQKVCEDRLVGVLKLSESHSQIKNGVSIADSKNLLYL
jgi:hypothetical protein